MDVHLKTSITTVLYQCPAMGFLPQEFRVAFPGESHLRQSRAAKLTLHTGCFSVSIIHRTLTWTTDYGIFNAHTDVNVCHCTWACTDTVRKSALIFNSGRKIPCRTGESNLRRRRAGPMLYQLSYIPTRVFHTETETTTTTTTTNPMLLTDKMHYTT